MDIHERLEGLAFKSEVNFAIKQYLKANGYYVDNLWQISDITDRFKDCSDDLAYQILDEVMQSEYIITMIQETLCEHAVEEYKLKFKNDA
jgi:hypothetical protein